MNSLKKILCGILSATMLTISTTVPAMASDDIKVVLNGKTLSFDVPPQIINERTMVPIRAIFEALGASVDWNQETQTATAIQGNNEIIVQMNNSIINYKTNGVSDSYTCDVLPQIVSDRILVPVRAIAEVSGCKVDWNGESQTVIITDTTKLTVEDIENMVAAYFNETYDVDGTFAVFHSETSKSKTGYSITVRFQGNNATAANTLFKMVNVESGTGIMTENGNYICTLW